MVVLIACCTQWWCQRWVVILFSLPVPRARRTLASWQRAGCVWTRKVFEKDAACLVSKVLENKFANAATWNEIKLFWRSFIAYYDISVVDFLIFVSSSVVSWTQQCQWSFSITFEHLEKVLQDPIESRTTGTLALWQPPLRMTRIIKSFPVPITPWVGARMALRSFYLCFSIIVQCLIFCMKICIFVWNCFFWKQLRNISWVLSLLLEIGAEWRQKAGCYWWYTWFLSKPSHLALLHTTQWPTCFVSHTGLGKSRHPHSISVRIVPYWHFVGLAVVVYC